MWAALCLVLILATFIGLNFWSEMLARGTAVHISPHFSGGEVRQTISHGSYKTLLHRMVFDGIVSDRATGFVQVDWVPAAKQSLPVDLQEELDINGDGINECRVRVETVAGKAQLMQHAEWVLGLEPIIVADSERILRIRLRNPQK